MVARHRPAGFSHESSVPAGARPESGAASLSCSPCRMARTARGYLRFARGPSKRVVSTLDFLGAVAAVSAFRQGPEGVLTPPAAQPRSPETFLQILSRGVNQPAAPGSSTRSPVVPNPLPKEHWDPNLSPNSSENAVEHSGTPPSSQLSMPPTTHTPGSARAHL